MMRTHLPSWMLRPGLLHPSARRVCRPAARGETALRELQDGHPDAVVLLRNLFPDFFKIYF